jgi:hypothetical protein
MSRLPLLQLNLSGSADAATDRMDQSTPHKSNAAANKADADVAAADADAANPAAAVPPAEPPAGGYPAPTLQHLVLVAGHAVYTGVDYALAAKESSWFLEPYQQVRRSENTAPLSSAERQLAALHLCRRCDLLQVVSIAAVPWDMQRNRGLAGAGKTIFNLRGTAPICCCSSSGHLVVPTVFCKAYAWLQLLAALAP